MPPRKSPRVRPTPTPRSTTPRVTPSSGETPTPNPPFQMNPTQLQTFMAQGIAAAIAAYETARSETSEGNRNGGGNPVINQTNSQQCTYKDFMSCKPRNFHGNEGVVGLTRWIEKMESVFRLCSCPDDSRIKFATCTLLDSALTWWNDHSKSMGVEVAYALTWKEFKTMMMDEYCPRQEIQALEQELWNLSMKGSEVAAYTSRFNDLSNLCPGMVNPEYKKIERYIWGLSAPVQGLVTASRPTTYDSAKQLAYRLTDQCIRQGTMAPQTEKNQTRGTKRKFQEEYNGNSETHKPESELVAVYATTTNTPNQSRPYSGKHPFCAKCNFHHIGNCRICSNCNKRGHTSQFCRKAPTTAADTPATV